MAIVSAQEIIDLVIMISGVAFIFKDYFPVRKSKWEPTRGDFWFSVWVTAPAVVFHELAHKFAAILLGMNASFHAAYSFLALGIGLKLLNFPFIFFVPGYVSIFGSSNPLLLAITALAGPALNLALWIGAWIVLEQENLKNRLNKIQLAALVLTKQINMFLFFLNMLPIPGIDGFSVYTNLFRVFGA